MQASEKENSEEQLRERLVEIFLRVKNNFVFIEDRGVENWKMPPDGYNGTQMLRDDCDGFCLACRSLLRIANIPNRLVYCEVRHRGRRFGHLVVEVGGWILDNRESTVVSNTILHGYTWLRISGYSPKQSWYEIINW
jgi:predicted transglutaminase-like cysteine proteinase